jgi:hypothetical protein
MQERQVEDIIPALTLSRLIVLHIIYLYYCSLGCMPVKKLLHTYSVHVKYTRYANSIKVLPRLQTCNIHQITILISRMHKSQASGRPGY